MMLRTKNTSELTMIKHTTAEAAATTTPRTPRTTTTTTTTTTAATTEAAALLSMIPFCKAMRSLNNRTGKNILNKSTTNKTTITNNTTHITYICVRSAYLLLKQHSQSRNSSSSSSNNHNDSNNDTSDISDYMLKTYHADWTDLMDIWRISKTFESSGVRD